jgi:hypothetical protein
MSEHHGHGVTRREVLVGVAGGLALAAIDPAPAFAQGATVSGQVFEDRDGSGMASAANPGLAGVLVANGRDIAVTGADGRYTLPLPDEATIFVVKPAGFMPPLEPLTNLPRFYRHHQPKGSPPELNLTFEGLAPTGALPTSVDFALRRQDEPNAFNVVMVTDPQPETGAEVDFIREDLIQALSGVEAKFGFTAGDHRHDRAAVVEHRRQPRSQFRSARPPIQPRDFQARVRPQLLCLFLRSNPLSHARRRELSRLRSA